MRVGAGLVLEDDESEEELLQSPPPAPRATLFATILDEAKTGSKDTAPDQSIDAEEHELATEEGIARPTRARRRVQILTQPVTYGLLNEDKEELEQHEQGIEGARARFTTAVSLCKKKHIRLVCHWSFSDPTNRKGTWRLSLADYRHETTMFDNGVDEHAECDCKKRAELLTTLGWRMIQDYEQHEDRLYGMMTAKKRKQDARDGVEKTRSPPLVQVIRALGPLIVYVMGNTGDRGRKGDDDKTDATSGKDGEGEKRQKDAVVGRREAQKAAELLRLKKRMEEQAARKAADQKRVEQRAHIRAEAQKMANGAYAVKSLLTRSVSSARTRGGRTATKQDQTNKHKHGQKLVHKLEQPISGSDLTKEERKALRNIQAAQREEADQLDEAEKAEEEEKLQIAAEQEEAGTNVEEDEEEEDGDEDYLAKAINEALGNSSPEPEPAMKKPAKASASPAAGRKKGPKRRTRFVIEDSSEESDNVKAPEPGKAPKPKPKAPPKIRKPTVSFADHLLAKTSARTDKENNKEETKELRKTEPIVDTIAVSNEKNGDIAKKMIETTTFSVEIQQQDGSTNRTEITETTVVSSNSSDQSKVTVERITHTQASTALQIPEQQLPSNSPPSSPDRELQDGFNTPTNSMNISITVTSPNASSSFPETDKVSPPNTRKRKPPTEETQCEPTTHSTVHDTAPSPKKRKATPRSSPATENTIASKNTLRSQEHTQAPQNNTPASPGAASTTSSTSSSSSKKRKMIWPEGGGELNISPGGTKRGKRVRFGDEVVGEVALRGDVEADGTSEHGEKVEVGGEGRGQRDEVDGTGEEDGDFDSLFGSPISDRVEGEGCTQHDDSIDGAVEGEDDFDSLFGSPIGDKGKA